MKAALLLSLAILAPLAEAGASPPVARPATGPPALHSRPDGTAPDPAPARAPRLLLNACGGDGGSVEYWARVLRAPHRDDRVRAARSLGENRTPAAVPALLGALRDEDVEVRLTAIRALGSFGQRAQAAVPALEHALTDTAPAIRAEAAKALARIRTP